MSGHNKWSKIKHKKAATDAKKSKEFTKINRLLTVEAKKANGNIDSPNLKAAIEKARSANMPNDNIERAIKKATDTTAADMEAVTYEAYGPGGSAIIIEALTDNRNKAAAEIRHVLSQYTIELAATGSASWAFAKDDSQWTPNTTIPLSDDDSQKLALIIDALEDNDDIQDVYTNAGGFE